LKAVVPVTVIGHDANRHRFPNNAGNSGCWVA
jgi:hypothetical protein